MHRTVDCTGAASTIAALTLASKACRRQRQAHQLVQLLTMVQRGAWQLSRCTCAGNSEYASYFNATEGEPKHIGLKMLRVVNEPDIVPKVAPPAAPSWVFAGRAFSVNSDAET